MYRTLSPKCHFTDCMTPLENDDNCTRASETLQSRLQPYHGNVVADMKMLKDEINKVLENIRVVSMIIDGDYREGIEFVNENVKEMINIVTKMIEVRKNIMFILINEIFPSENPLGSKSRCNKNNQATR